MLYVDDSVLLVSEENPKDISNTLTKELQSCSEWLVNNKLSLHLGKMEAILCGSKRKLINVQDFEVKSNGVSIKSVSAVKYLGINIDSDMSGETTWKTIISKCNSRLKPGHVIVLIKAYNSLYGSFTAEVKLEVK